ncbi:hypothetical protein [Dyella sp.]|jgi:hypothetical protein|uniref:hypothetical protein n=1 Tax=Dyella sp. TaxID=1869338 RepID=UPI002D786B8B|nr:hypothetical protein [Dyella sp.]HET6433408.1 hypothetical protein [Dyella sp.]
MKTLISSTVLASALGLALCGSPSTAQADDLSNAQMNCTMDFTLSGWSAVYKTANGKGELTCGGKTVPVTLSAEGGGLTVGKYKITDGQATFSNVNTMQEVFGDYAMASAHAGVVKSARTAVMSKGSVTMALTGTGNGWDIGVGFGQFTIKPAVAAGMDTVAQ